MGEHAYVVHPDGEIGGQLAAYLRRYDDLCAAFLFRYRSPKTIESYRTSLKQWGRFCDLMGFDPINAQRPWVDIWMHQLELNGRSPRTRSLRLTSLRCFFEYLVEESVIPKNPAKHVTRPKFDRATTTGFLRSGQMNDLVRAAKAFSPTAYALCSVLNFNGLRIGELCNANVEDLERREEWPVLWVTRKGGARQWVELDRTTELALLAAIGDRTSGPLLLTRYGTRLTQQAASRILKRLRPFVRDAPDRIHPHMIRHSWATQGMRVGVPRERMIRDGGWSSGRMLDEIYNHAVNTPGSGACHLVSSSVLSG